MKCKSCAQSATVLLYCSSGYLLLILIPFCLTAASSAAASPPLSFDWPNAGADSAGGEGNISKFPSDGYVDLTVANNDPHLSVGHLYYPDLLPLWNSSTLDSASFNCSFRFQIVNQSIDQIVHADGLAFVLQDPAAPDVLNTSKGVWLGLFNASTNATSVGVVAVEFDTFQNSFDPNDNHIGIDVNSINSVASEPDLGFTLASSATIFSWVDYSSSQALLEVYATNQSDDKPTSPLLSFSINLTWYLPESVRIGFSASTGAAADHHRLYSWSFNSSTIGIATPTPTPTPTPQSPLIVDPPVGKKLDVGLFAGVAVGIFLVLAVPIVLLGLRRRRQRQRRFDWQMQSSEIDMIGLPAVSEGPHRFNYRDLVEATRNFEADFLLGQGGFGSVYRGVLPEDGSEVAVKRISQKAATKGEKDFFAEVSIISCIRHKNLVQLKGWCRDKGNLLLVYEYLPNRSLDCYLFDDSSSSTLDWKKRYNIVSGLGSALQYLHQGCERTIVHRDIKASNVMLDTNYNAKLGDFGLARQLGDGAEGHTTLPAGTVGYMAPEIYGTGRATTESDVYSYGIVLLEVACGRRPLDASLPAQFQSRLLDWVWDLHSKERLIEVCDSRLGGGFDEEQLVRTLRVGLACAHPDPKERPSIHLALEALQGRVPLPPIPTLKPVAHYGPPLPVNSLFTTSTTTTSSSCVPMSSASSSSAQNSDLSETALLHSHSHDIV